jgi:hypothetical protein
VKGCLGLAMCKCEVSLRWIDVTVLHAWVGRTTEAEQWASRANVYYGRAGGLNSLPLHGIFGALDSLKQVT